MTPQILVICTCHRSPSCVLQQFPQGSSGHVNVKGRLKLITAVSRPIKECCAARKDSFMFVSQLDNPDPVMAKAVTVSYRAFLNANMWMGFGYSSDNATEVTYSNSKTRNSKVSIQNVPASLSK